MMAYNSCVHSSTGYSAFSLLFGRSMWVPLDLTGYRPRNAIQTHNYEEDLVPRLEYAYGFARAQIHLLQDRSKDRYDSGGLEKEVTVGDFVRIFQTKPKRGIPFKFHLPWSEPKQVVGIQWWYSLSGMRSPTKLRLHFDRVSVKLPPRKRDKKACVLQERALF